MAVRGLTVYEWRQPEEQLVVQMVLQWCVESHMQRMHVLVFATNALTIGQLKFLRVLS